MTKNNKPTESGNTFWRTMAIRHALETPSKAKEAEDALKWYKRTKSDNPEVVADAFRQDWKEIEKLIEDPKDKEKLKKKFGIK